MTTLHHITLELAREQGHPFGDRNHGYHLYLPLTEDHRIDAEACKRLGGACRVRRLRPGEPPANGRIVHGPGGRWIFDYTDKSDADSETGFRLGAETFVPGEYVSIKEDDGVMHTFQVIEVRRE